MIRALIIGAGAGLSCTVLYASIAHGSLVSVALFYLAPLPLFIVYFGWGSYAGLTAAAVACLAGLLALGPNGAMMIMVTASLPAAWLGRLALMWRDTQNTQGALSSAAQIAQRQWYPVGQLIVWTAGIATMLVAIVMITMGGDIDKFRALATEMLRQMITAGADGGTLPGMSKPQMDRFIAFMVWILPVVSAVIYMMSTLLNMWLAGWITRRSGLLTRPAPTISAISYPRWLMIALSGTLLLMLLPGFPGLMAAVAASTIIVAFALQGLAVIHVLAANSAAGPLLLLAAYTLLILFNWLIVLALSALGLAESVFSFRRKVGAFKSGGMPPDNT